MGISLDNNNLGLDFPKKRMDICKKCPLFMKLPFLHPICNPNLYMDPTTGLVSTILKLGYKKGCSCDLIVKHKNIDASCPLGKW